MKKNISFGAMMEEVEYLKKTSVSKHLFLTGCFFTRDGTDGEAVSNECGARAGFGGGSGAKGGVIPRDTCRDS